AEAMWPDLAIDHDRTRTDKRGELASGASSRQIHLEESLLRVEDAHRAGDVFTRRATNRRNAQSVARDRHRRGEAGDTQRAIELRKARPELRTHVQACGQPENQNEAE